MPILIDGVLTYREPIQHKRGTSAYIQYSNYIPAACELVVETDSGRIKAGDGIKALKDLPYSDEKILQAFENFKQELSQQIQEIQNRVEVIENKNAESSDDNIDEVFDEIFTGNTQTEPDNSELS